MARTERSTAKADCAPSEDGAPTQGGHADAHCRGHPPGKRGVPWPRVLDFRPVKFPGRSIADSIWQPLPAVFASNVLAAGVGVAFGQARYAIAATIVASLVAMWSAHIAVDAERMIARVAEDVKGAADDVNRARLMSRYERLIECSEAIFLLSRDLVADIEMDDVKANRLILRATAVSADMNIDGLHEASDAVLHRLAGFEPKVTNADLDRLLTPAAKSVMQGIKTLRDAIYDREVESRERRLAGRVV